MKKIIILIFVNVLIGCSITPYTPPKTGQPTAHLTYRVSGNPTLGYTASLWSITDKNNKGCFAARTLMANINNGNPLDMKTNNPSSIPVLAGKEIAITSIFAPANLMSQIGCRQNIQFIPKANEKYILDVQWNKSCVINIYKSKKEIEEKINAKTQSQSC